MTFVCFACMDEVGRDDLNRCSVCGQTFCNDCFEAEYGMCIPCGDINITIVRIIE